MKLDSLKRRLQALEPAPAPASHSFLGLESLSDADLDAKIENLIRRLEQRGITLDFLHQEMSCDSCTGNSRSAWCYSWHGDDLRICPPVR